MKIQDHINRLIELNQIQRSTGDFMGDAFYDEYVRHQSKVVQRYLPLLSDLADAGLLAVWVRDLNEQREIESVCINGGFQLNAETFPVDLAAPLPYQSN